MNNSDTVMQIYRAFAEGNVPAIIDKLSENVEWEYGTVSVGAPWLIRRDGREDVAGFFRIIKELDFHKFEPKEIIEGNAVVVVLLDIDFTVRSTGRRVRERDEIHVFRFGTDGLITTFRHGADTLAHYLASRASEPARDSRDSRGSGSKGGA